MIGPTRNDQPGELLEILSPNPRLYVLSRPVFDQEELERFCDDEYIDWRRTPGATAAEDIVEFSGRICYMSFGEMQSPKSNRQYIQNLIKQRHESVLEHVSWSFLLTGVSRAFTHQLVRHRVGFSFSQLSQQYHDETGAKFVMPEEVRDNPVAAALWLRLIEELRGGYQSVADNLDPRSETWPSLDKESRRAIRSAARSILPNATETKIVFSANARASRHFLDVRGAIIGDLEMRRVSALLYSRLHIEAPQLLSDFKMTLHEDGYPIVASISGVSETVETY